MYRPKHFTLDELIWKEYYEKLTRDGKQWVAWRRFDDRFLRTSDQLREQFGPIYYNTYNLKEQPEFLNGQIFEFSVARPEVIPDYVPENERWSLNTTHMDFNSGDPKFLKCGKLNRADKIQAYKDIYNYIIKHQDKFPFINMLEDIEWTKTWIHFSTGNWFDPGGRIKIIRPI